MEKWMTMLGLWMIDVRSNACECKHL